MFRVLKRLYGITKIRAVTITPLTNFRRRKCPKLNFHLEKVRKMERSNEERVLNCDIIMIIIEVICGKKIEKLCL